MSELASAKKRGRPKLTPKKIEDSTTSNKDTTDDVEIVTQSQSVKSFVPYEERIMRMAMARKVPKDPLVITQDTSLQSSAYEQCGQYL